MLIIRKRKVPARQEQLLRHKLSTMAHLKKLNRLCVIECFIHKPVTSDIKNVITIRNGWFLLTL